MYGTSYTYGDNYEGLILHPWPLIYLIRDLFVMFNFNNSSIVPIMDECKFNHLDGEVGCGKLELR